MAIYEVISTPSVRSMARRKKSDIVHRIHMLEDHMGRSRGSYATEAHTAESLARIYMKLFRQQSYQNGEN